MIYQSVTSRAEPLRGDGPSNAKSDAETDSSLEPKNRLRYLRRKSGLSAVLERFVGTHFSLDRFLHSRMFVQALIDSKSYLYRCNTTKNLCGDVQI